MNFDANRLFELLPAVYRLRDAEAGGTSLTQGDSGPLKELLSILAGQIAVMEDNLDQLYDDQFIETCAEWVVPYLGDLVGTRGIVVFPDAKFSQRSQVANTLSYRRRKGTAAIIEQLARDVTGWDANVVEYFKLMATTQFMNHLRPDNLSIAPVSETALLETLQTPFDKITRTADVRRIEPKRGRYNLPNVGIYLWRIGSYPMTKSPAFRVDDRRYTFSGLGLDTPLYNHPVTETEITHLAEPINVPMPLSRSALIRNLDTYYGADGRLKSLLIWVNGKPVTLPRNSSESNSLSNPIIICNLSNVKDIEGNDILDASGQPIGWVNMPQQKLAIDPELGRLAFPTLQPPPATVHVSYQYGFSANMGGGEYGRSDTFTTELLPLVHVSKTDVTKTIQSALDQLANKGEGGIVEILDNDYYVETLVVRIPSGKTVELRAADQKRPILVLTGDLTVLGEANAVFILNGLLVSRGRLLVPIQNSAGIHNHLAAIRVRHCTLLPGASPTIDRPEGRFTAQDAMPRLVVEVPNSEVELDQSIVGSLRVTDEAVVNIRNTIVDALQPTEVAFSGLLVPNPALVFEANKPGASLTVENSTIIGKVHTLVMSMASNTIFLASLSPDDQWPAPVLADRLQKGCVRFSYIPPGSRLPSAHQCQPKTMTDVSRVRPIFTSTRYGDAGYGQLSPHCSQEISQGADDSAEMGAFHNLYQPQRMANLRLRLDEYLRFGLEAGIYWAS